MRRISKLLVLVLVLAISAISLCGCGIIAGAGLIDLFGKDKSFNEVIDIIDENTIAGESGATFYVSESLYLVMMHTEDEKEIYLSAISSGVSYLEHFYIVITKGDDEFMWSMKYEDYHMEGKNDKSSFSESTNLLYYTYTDAPSYLKEGLGKLASTSAKLALTSFNAVFREKGITAYDLGFSNFR